MATWTNQPLSAIDSALDSYGWTGGWRIQEDAATTLSSTCDNPPYLFPYLPFVFIIDTETMEIAAADSGDAVNPVEVDILDVLAEIAGES
jgi:hypothetical protein